MKKYNLSAEEIAKFLYRGKINRIKEEDIYSFLKNPTETEINYFREYFISKNKYEITYEDIEETEKRLGVKFPKILREYYHECGDLNINQCFSSIFDLDEIDFSNNWLRENLEDDEIPKDEQEKIINGRDNFLIFWSENQGVWYAGIKKEDLDMENPPIYLSQNDDIYFWEKITEDIETFIISEIIENLQDSEFYFETPTDDEIREIITDEKISMEELNKSNFQNLNRTIKISSYADYDKNIIYFFILEDSKILKSYIVKTKEKKKKDFIVIKNKISKKDKSLIEIGNIISKGDKKVVSQLNEIFSNFKNYIMINKEFEFLIKDMENISIKEELFLKFYTLSNVLEKNGYLCCLDWKCELEDFKMISGLLEKFTDDKICRLDSINFDEDDDITTWCEIFDEKFKNKNILIAGFDLNSDSYTVFPISYEDFEKIQNLIGDTDLRIDFAKNL